MKKGLKKEVRMKSFVDRSNALIKEGKTPEATKMMVDGLNYYNNRIVQAISPYSASDTALITAALRNLADEMEKGNPDAKLLRMWIEQNAKKPELNLKTEIRKPNKE